MQLPRSLPSRCSASCSEGLERDRAFQAVVTHVNQRKRRLAVTVEALQHFAQELLALFDKLFERVPADIEPLRENRVPQASGRLGHEPLMRRHCLEVRLHRAAEIVPLSSELQVVVKDLLLFLERQVMNVDDNLTFLEQRKRALLQVFARAVVNVVARGHDDFGALAKHRLDLRQHMIPAVDEKILVLLDAERVINPKKLRRLVRVPPIGNLTGVVELQHQRAPLVDGGHRQHGGYRGLARRRLADKQHEPVLVQRSGGLLIRGRHDDLGEVVAHRFQDNARLLVGAVV
jgi:hypothetical protein